MKKLFLAVSVLCFVLVAAASAEEFSADMTMDVMGIKSMGKVYFKNYDISRSEMDTMGIKMISIVNDPKSYQIFPDTRKYVVTDLEELKKQNPLLDVDDFEDWVEKNDLKKVGTDTVEGYKCDVYEGDISYVEGQPAMPMKLWYAKKLDYAIKYEATMQSPMAGKMTAICNNIKEGKQPAELFKVPSGYTEAKDVQEAMGLGGFSMPTGGDSGQVPSQGDMENMMNSLKDMMGGAQE